MKTRANKITDRRAGKLSSILAAVIPRLLPALVLILTIESSSADSATWVGGQGGPDHVGDWNFTQIEGPTNWNPDTTIPNGAGQTATFGVSDFRNVFISENTEVGSIVFNAGGDAFTITVGQVAGQGQTLTISGEGIKNNSGQTQ